MSKQTWILTDVGTGVYESDFRISSADMPAAEGSWSVSRRRLQGGLSDGVDLVEINNGRMCVYVIPTRGMGIWKAAINGETLGWQSPVRGPVHPQFVPLFDPSGIGWLEGFDELLVRCGLESNGAPEFNERGQLIHPLHGRIANRPAHRVELTIDDSAGTITVCGFVEETRFHFQKLRLAASVTTRFDCTSFTINDTVENFGGTPAEMQMLYHLNIGQPTLKPGDQLVAPLRAIEDSNGPVDKTTDWQSYGQPIAGQPEQVYFLDLQSDEAGRTQVLLKNAEGTAGTTVSYQTDTLPCFTVWKNLVAYKDGYVTGLEPGTNLPNCKSVEAEQGRVVHLAPGESWSSEITVERLTNAKEVNATVAAIGRLEDQIE